jgi:hypothetical protein
MTERLWKVLGPGRQSLVSGTKFTYPAHNAWTEHLDPGKLAECKRGYHYCTDGQILEWLAEGLLCEIKPCPKHDPLNGDGKSVSCRLRIVYAYRLDARVLRLFACDCAERALRRERRLGREPDPRCWEAVRVARRYAEGKATDAERAAAGTAARDAAGTAAGTAAWAAARDAAGTAAGTAARDAAWTAAGTAAGTAARDAERGWQYRQLLKLAGAA